METESPKKSGSELESVLLTEASPSPNDGDTMPTYLQDIFTPFNDHPVDLRDWGESVDDYWANGWTVDFVAGSRCNWDYYGDSTYKVFPTRYRLDEFHLTKSMRRVLNKNRDLEYIVRPLRITPAKEELYYKHHVKRFRTTPRQPLAQRYEYIVHNPSTLMEICFFDAERLVAFSIFEVGDRAVYSNNGSWPMSEHRRGLGTLTILKEIEYARSRNCKYYYLGFYYTQNPAYAYKTRFPGLELYDWQNRRWVRYDDPYAQELLQEEFPEDEDC